MKVLPGLPFANAASRRDRDPDLSREVGCSPRVSDDQSCLLFGNFRVSVPRSVGDCPMTRRILSIIGGVSVIEIGRAIIERIAISVAHQILPDRGWSVKRLSDQPVDLGAPQGAIMAKGYAGSTSAIDSLRQNLACPRSASAPFSADSTHRRDSIIRCRGNCPPCFSRVIKVSHFALHCVFGQGLALLTQRLRPAFPNRIMICSQGGGV